MSDTGKQFDEAKWLWQDPGEVQLWQRRIGLQFQLPRRHEDEWKARLDFVYAPAKFRSFDPGHVKIADNHRDSCRLDLSPSLDPIVAKNARNSVALKTFGNNHCQCNVVVSDHDRGEWIGHRSAEPSNRGVKGERNPGCSTVECKSMPVIVANAGCHRPMPTENQLRGS